MLVLTRKEGERINIGQDVVVKVISISGNKVRVGVEAPGDVRILRAELELDVVQDQVADHVA
ncbi:MAG: carbon storage regulator [Planctomycetales bacterium]